MDIPSRHAGLSKDDRLGIHPHDPARKDLSIWKNIGPQCRSTHDEKAVNEVWYEHKKKLSGGEMSFIKTKRSETWQMKLLLVIRYQM